jgi:hypothetical protein
VPGALGDQPQGANGFAADAAQLGLEDEGPPPSVLAPLSDDGRNDMLAMIVAMCRAHNRLTLGEAIAQTFDGYRDMQDVIRGINCQHYAVLRRSKS